DSLASIEAKGLEHERPWVDKVKRIVLLAGMNRGWSISHHMSPSRAIEMRAGVAIGYILDRIFGHPPLILSIRRGSPFITQLRLQWLAMEQAKANGDKSVGGVQTVQLLGAIDDVVSPDDNIDLITGSRFSHLEVPESGHLNVIAMDDTDVGRKRQRVLIE